jgi:hypothetical protein
MAEQRPAFSSIDVRDRLTGSLKHGRSFAVHGLSPGRIVDSREQRRARVALAGGAVLEASQNRLKQAVRMTNKRRVTEEPESDEYLLKEAWQVVTRHIQYAEVMPKGAPQEDLVAMIFAFHTMEGYLNYVGRKIAPELWANERVAFRQAGLSGRLNAVYERCGIGKPNKGRRPYSTLSDLEKLWDRMAHRAKRGPRGAIPFQDPRPSQSLANSTLARIVSHKKAVKARDDVKRIIDEINGAAISRFPQARLGADALEGIQRSAGHQGHSSPSA